MLKYNKFVFYCFSISLRLKWNTNHYFFEFIKHIKHINIRKESSMKKFLLLLSATTTMQSMHAQDVPTLVSICVQKITKEMNQHILNEQCDLLAQKIDKQFFHIRHSTKLDLFEAITTLNSISTISQENNFLIITPKSITIKNLPKELAKQILKKNSWEGVTPIQKLLFEKLYDKSSITKQCMDIYIKRCSGDLLDLVLKGVLDIPWVMKHFACKKNLEEREAKNKESEKNYYLDDWCP